MSDPEPRLPGWSTRRLQGRPAQRTRDLRYAIKCSGGSSLVPCAQKKANMTRDQLMHLEWRNWQTLCRLLREAKAVTGADLTSPQSARATPGQRLFQAIREWGDSLVELRISSRLNHPLPSPVPQAGLAAATPSSATASPSAPCSRVSQSGSQTS